MNRLSKWVLLGICVTLLTGPVFAEDPEDQYVPIYMLMQQAEELEQAGSGAIALAKLREAQTQLNKLQAAFPMWNTKLVGFRQRYMTAKISSLEKLYPGVGLPSASIITNAPVAADVQAQLDELRSQLRLALADREILQGKLREALSVQPAASDPRELAKADDRVRQLQKENDTLQVALTQEKLRAAKMVGTDKIEDFQKSVEELRKKLAKQTELMEALAREKAALQKRLSERQPATADARELKKAQETLAETQSKLELQSQLAVELAKDKAAVEQHLHDAVSRLAKMADPDDLKAAQSALEEARTKLKRQIYVADEFAMQKAALQEKLSILEREKEILQKKVKQQE